MEINRIVLIGNGFDLAHNLPTRYINFRKYLDEQDWRFLMKLEKILKFQSKNYKKSQTYQKVA